MKCLALLVGLALALPAAATTYVVRPDGTGDYPTIQAAIDAAQNGDTVLLTNGIFLGDGNRDLDFAGKAISVAAQSVEPESCVIDCQGSAESPHRGFYFHSGETNASRVEGITIAHGVAAGTWPTGAGGAVLSYQAEPVIERCRFIDNQAGWGGAVAVGSASLHLDRCTFLGNVAAYRGGAADGFTHGNLFLDHCTLALNSAPCGAGVGGNMYCTIQLTNVILAFGTDGGSVCCTNNSSATASCCDVYGNAQGDYVDGLSGQLGANGNIRVEPLFCNLPLYNVRLQPGSPCAAEHQPVCGQIGAWPVGCEGHVPTTYVVRPDGTGDYPTIQAAIEAVLPGDTIELTDGIFTGAGNRDIWYNGRWVTIRSQSGDARTCIVDCQGSETETHRGFLFVAGEGATSVLADVTIRGGYERGTWPAGGGGAVLCRNSSPTITGCIFVGNHAAWGGAIAAEDGTLRPADCTFAGNVATHWGGAIECRAGANLDLHRCTVVGNTAPSGSAIGWDQTGALRLARSILAYNSPGGPLICTTGAAVDITCCDVYGNMPGDYVNCLEGHLGVDGNISADPRFCDPAALDFHLEEGSICADENQPQCGQIGAWPVGCPAHPPTVFTVPADGSGEWPTIQAAIDAARGGDTIELGDGTFRGPGNRDLDFGWKALNLQSQSGDAAACVIDAEGSAEAPHRGFALSPATISGSTIRNVTVTNGYADLGGGLCAAGQELRVEGCNFSANHARRGGGISATGGAPTMEDCRFVENAADSAGGAVAVATTSRARIVNCAFEANTAARLGGALYVTTAVLDELSGCALTGNGAENGGGAMFYNTGFSSVARCTFSGNVASASGGGLFCQGGSPAIDDCLFAVNQAVSGGGVYSRDADPVLTLCTLAENGALQGAGVYVRDRELTLANSIIAFSPSGEAVRCEYTQDVFLSCCDLFGNAGGDWVGCVESQAGQYDNLSADPLFCGAGSQNGPYALQLDSPCAPQNNPACGLIGAGPVGCGAESAPDVSEEPTRWTLALAPNQPNPFASETLIGYTVPGRGGKRDVALAVYDAAGRRVRTLIDAQQTAGPRRVVWRGSDDAGAPVASGIYFCRIRVGDASLTRRLTLLR